MKTEPKPTPIPHPTVICGDDKGGVTKSTTCGAVADALRALGYKVRLADADHANHTLSLMVPDAERIDCRDQDALSEFIAAGPQSGADISLVDMPGGAGDILEKYFDSVGFDTFGTMGIRIIVALTMTQTADSVRGAKAWIRAFIGKSEFVAFQNERDTPSGQKFTLQGIEFGADVLEIAGGRIATIPRWSEYMTKHYQKAKGVPSDYMLGGRVAKELKLNPLSAAPWQIFHRRVTVSVAGVAEFLTGKPCPIPPPTIKEDQISPENAKLLAKLAADD